MSKFLIIVFSISTFFACKEQSTETIKVVDVATFKEALTINPDIQLIDVRTPKEYDEGYIENAMLVNFLSEDFKEKIQELDKEKPVYLYCKSGGRSGKASKLMIELGFQEIVDLKGGYMAWSKQFE